MWLQLMLAFQLIQGGSESAQPAQPQIPSEIPDGYMLIEGDILVPLDFYETRATHAANLWPGGVVPFEFNANVTDQNRQRARDAMLEWEAVAPVWFVERTNQENFIHIQSGAGNNSMVGMVGGRQVVNIVSWTSRFIIAHELAHALGFWHEQSRPDRDDFVTIEFGNIQDGFAHNFDVHPDAGVFGPYDFDSVMQYDDCSFSVCCPAGSSCNCVVSCATIVAHDPTQQSLMGQRSHLSTLDRQGMSSLYAPGDWIFVDWANQGMQDGSARFPFSDFRQGANHVVPGGTLSVMPGTYNAVGVYSTAMHIRNPYGTIVLR